MDHRQLIARLLFPLLILGGVSLHLLLSNRDVPAMVATFAPVIVGGLLISVLERLIPARQQWWPRWRDFVTDGVFMVVVQGVTPKVVAFVFLIVLVKPLHRSSPNLAHLWPADWPIPAQLVMFLLIADFNAYWLHRGAHRFSLLWRLHSVHHSPDRLYFLNVGRFHPLEKLLQISVSTTPLLVFGAGQKVISAYFVFYALHGFLQHCNIDLKLGVLNFLFSGPELHRWHHSESPAESDHNFGNNLILWDIVFGTRYLSTGRRVERLGLITPTADNNFRSLIKMPFGG